MCLVLGDVRGNSAYSLMHLRMGKQQLQVNELSNSETNLI